MSTQIQKISTLITLLGNGLKIMSSSDERKQGSYLFNHLTNFIEGPKTKTIRLEELSEENKDSDE